MSPDTPMPTRRRRSSTGGFGTQPPAPAADPGPDVPPSDAAGAGTARGARASSTPQNSAVPVTAGATPPATTTSSDDAEGARVRKPRPRAVDPKRGDEAYYGAHHRVFGMKLLDPAREQLEQTLAQLSDRGHKSDLTEIVHALILSEAADVDQMVVRVKRLRAAKNGLG